MKENRLHIETDEEICDMMGRWPYPSSVMSRSISNAGNCRSTEVARRCRGVYQHNEELFNIESEKIGSPTIAYETHTSDHCGIAQCQDTTSQSHEAQKGQTTASQAAVRRESSSAMLMPVQRKFKVALDHSASAYQTDEPLPSSPSYVQIISVHGCTVCRQQRNMAALCQEHIVKFRLTIIVSGDRHTYAP
ncbi:hypothetical protein NPIL_361351 [Nephila pilipes]|uniref:Uncharacterized protein n=1 Tax=Nephila pilipes TaxID=299642 RepID=A0A8X6NRJ9_NEPPI|nr:hypothetical protein NPIL_361351 [Nephila pilipes]